VIRVFRWVGYLEAASFLCLLLIAMPLKYLFGIPEGVRFTGALHGGLFIAYCFLAMHLANRDNWSLKQLVLAWISAFLPCGTIYFDRKFMPKN
jgi:integral membrane protein